MKLDLFLLPAWAALASATFTGLNIPQKDMYVTSMLSRFGRYRHYTATVPARATSTLHPLKPAATAGCGDYWMENIQHRGVAAFNGNSAYKVFRNVKDFGAKGDGVTDDTAAINTAISSGSRHGPAGGTSSTNTPAVVYFPAGTYLISSPIIDYYNTQLIGNPNCLPVLRATPNFSGTGGTFGLIDGDALRGFGSTVLFWRQIRNFVFDMTLIPGTTPATGIHWNTAQATSLQNLVFQMSDIPGTQHQGVFIEDGSGGWMTDLTFNGGLFGLNAGNQQFTSRNMKFNNVVTAISQIWDWGWTYTGISINNCSVGLDMSSIGANNELSVNAVTIIDSTISDTPIGIKTSRSANSQPPSAGSLVLENVKITNVNTAVQGPSGPVLAGGTRTIQAWAQGHLYNPTGPNDVQQPITANPRSASLLQGTSYYARSKPQYESLPLTAFISARAQGAKGDGTTDDSTALQKAINNAASAGKVLYVDAGTYKVTKTIQIPPGSKIVGETYSVIMSSGAFFANIASPKPVVRVGNPGQTGVVEWSDMIVSTQGQQGGAILIQWNLKSTASAPSGMWDVHTRIGGFIGSNLQGGQCPTTPGTKITSSNYKKNCVGAYLSMHITASSGGLYMENVWLWTADHDIDTNFGGNQITVYTARGLLCESTTGAIWLLGTSVEHHALYQYQFVNTRDIMMGQIQTETAYYQPNPDARIPFAPVASLHDPTFPTTPYTTGTGGVQVPNADGWGLRVVGSGPLFVYGAGHYSFFNNYSTSCSDRGNGEICQSRIVSIEKGNATAGSQVYMYDLHTVGTRVMLRNNGVDVALYQDNIGGFIDGVAVFKPS